MTDRPDFDYIVFEDRNREYGAFHLRKYYKSSVLTGFIVAALVFTSALSAPLIYTRYLGEKPVQDEDKVIVVDMLAIEDPFVPPPPPEEEIKQPEKPVETATVKNLELEVKPDAEVQNEEVPPTDEELTDKQSGVETKEGSDIAEVAPDPLPEPTPEPPKIETWAPEMPEFPGGPSQLLKFFSNYLEYTERAEAEGIQGTIRVSFVVNIDGTITEVKIVKGLGYGLDEQVIKAFKKMPKWKPARKGGKVVPLRMVSPVVFTLEDN